MPQSDGMPTIPDLYRRRRDKVSDKWASYLDAYDRLFSGYRFLPLRLLEIGVQNGGSLEIWAEYFPNARRIIGCDVDPRVAQLEYTDRRVVVIVGDANSDATQAAIRRRARVLELVIDDGSHRSSDVVRSFARYFAMVAYGGAYVVEDVHASYWSEFEGGLYHPQSSMAFFKRLADSVNHQHWGLAKADRDLYAGFMDEYGLALGEEVLRSVHSVEFMNSLCVIRKERPTRNLLGRRVVAGSHAAVEPDIVRHSREVLKPPDQSRNPWSARDMSPEEELPLRTVELAERETESRRLREQVRMAESARNERDAEVTRLAASLQAMSSELKDRQIQLRKSTAQARALESRLEATTNEASDVRRRLDTQAEHLRQTREQLGALQTSRSWRLTTPLRKAGAAARRLSKARLVAVPVLSTAARRGPLAAVRLVRDHRLIIRSGLFDSEYYMSHNPDVVAAHLEPTVHYLMHGSREGRRPNPIFNPDWYRRTNPDVGGAGIDPLTHYARFGAAEGRNPAPAFSTDAYLAANPDVARANVNPLGHYLRFGRLEGRPLRPQDARVAGPAHHSQPRRGWGRVAQAIYALLPARILASKPLRRVSMRVRKSDHKGETNYPEWIMTNDQLTDTDRAQIRSHISSLQRRPRLSVVMPVFNTPRRQLEDAINSVIAQLYEDWELCIADDGSTQRQVRAVLNTYAARDSRIHVRYRRRNGGISACTNTALESVSGEWIVLLDHDDTLAEHALYFVAVTLLKHPEAAVIYSDEDKLDELGRRHDPYFKPDFDEELFLGQNFVNHLGAYRADLATHVGFREGVNGSQDWDFALRVHAAAPEAEIVHVPFVLYHWRQTRQMFSTKELAHARASAETAARDYLASTGQSATVRAEGRSTYLRIQRRLPPSRPKVSVIVPTRDRADLLRTCVDGVLHGTDYAPIELILVDNGSSAPDAAALLKQLQRTDDVTVMRDDAPFNFSRLVNRGVAVSTGSVCVLLNNDVEVIEPSWLSEMVRRVVQRDVGAVGGLLYYPDDTIQHAGVVLGPGGVAGHAYLRWPRTSTGYFGQLTLAHTVSAVTAACLAVRREIYDELDGFNERDLSVAFNDVDFCLRLRQVGYRVIWTPHAKLYHHESASRGYETTPEKIRRFGAEVAYMRSTWGSVLDTDPFYNPNLSLDNWYALARRSRTPKPWREIRAEGAIGPMAAQTR